MRKIWGNLRFWHDHNKFHDFTKLLNKFHDFTKLLKITHFGSRDYFSQNFYLSHTAFQLLSKNMYLKFIWHLLGKYFPTLVNIFTKSHRIPPVPSERHLTPVILQSIYLGTSNLNIFQVNWKKSIPNYLKKRIPHNLNSSIFCSSC